MKKTNELRAARSRRTPGPGPTVGRPRKLSPDAVVDAALGLIDEAGMDKLSIRSLAKRLNVQANAIYTYYENLEAIENAVVTKLLSEIPMLDASSPVPLREQYIEHFVALRIALALHPRVAAGRVGSPAWTSNARHLNSVLGQLAERGIDIEVALLAHTALTGFSFVSALQDVADRSENTLLNRREALAAIKAMKADNVLRVMNLPQMKLTPDQRFRASVGALIDKLLPASMSKGAKRTATPMRG